MKGIILFCFFIVCSIQSTQGYTHWMVTESGLIQPRVDSPFELARPYDLLAFLNQETYWEDVIDIYNDLSKRQILIDELWDEVDQNTDIGVQVLSDDNCLKAGQLSQLDWYVTFSDDGSTKIIPEYEYRLTQPLFTMDTDVPDCKKISSLIFSMSTFEHLEAVIHRENITIPPELSLPEKVAPIMTIDQFGHWLSSVLRKNSSSWLHYNLASLFWRLRGNAPKAIECSRRAIHYAPRAYKDVALLGLGIILHVGKMAEDAVIVLNAAIDHNPNSYLSHFHLANAYAVLCEFNSSSNHLEQCLKINPNFDVAIKHKHGAVCLANIWKKLLVVKIALTKLRKQLSIYSEKEAQLLKSQSSLLKVMKHDEEYDYRSMVKNCQKMTELTGLDIKGLKLKGDKNSLIKYFLEGSTYTDLWAEKMSLQAVESAYSLQRLVRHIEKHTSVATEIMIHSEILRGSEENFMEISPIPDLLPNKRMDVKSEIKHEKKSNSQIEENLNEYEIGVQLFPPTMKINRNAEDFDKDPDWPSNNFCKEMAPHFPENVEAIFPVFLSFENKGILLGRLLTDKLEVSASQEYELPWHPPTCPQDKASAAFTQKKSQKNQLVGEVIKSDYIKQKLLEYVGDGDVDLVKHMQDAEIGQRIYAAIQKKLAPKWILYTLSSLYWRTRGNNGNALHCLLSANKTVPSRYKDIVLVSYASICLEMGYFDEALSAAEEAFRISLYEPATNFILAELNMLKKHRNTHMFHLKQVVRVDKDFLGGTAKNLLYGWACILKQVNALTEMDYGRSDVCTHIEPGVSMVCEKDGTNCHMTNVKCSNNKDKVDTSKIVRLLELKDESIQKSQVDNMDEGIFDLFLANMPKDRGDFLGHQLNFDSMMFTISNTLKGCGPIGCRNLQAEDMSLKEEDCGYHHLQLGYWLHIVCFKQPFGDGVRLPTEIVSMIPSNKKIPECRLSIDSSKDFFLERVVRLDPNGWEPVLSLMHQFAEMFSYFDYVTLGAKIAKFVETKPRSWIGALSAGWWCGAGGRGACAVRCLSAALALAPPQHTAHVMRALVALLHTQSKPREAKEIAYLSFYIAPKSKIEAFLVAVSHTCLDEYEQAVWMYRYALMYDTKFLPAKACLHATMCLMFYGESRGPSMEL